MVECFLFGCVAVFFSFVFFSFLVRCLCFVLKAFFLFGCVDYIFCKALCLFFVLLSRQKYQKRLLNVGFGLGSASLFPQRRQPQRLFCCPPQFFLYVTLTTTTHLGCRVQPSFDDRTSRFDIFLEKCGCNDTVDAFCRMEFVSFVIREFIPHRFM